MKELVRVESNIFDEIYEGINGNKKVVCILDNNCVRYTVFNLTKHRQSGIRHEFTDDKKELCFKNATKVLNK
jgi:hypothetical protein